MQSQISDLRDKLTDASAAAVVWFDKPGVWFRMQIWSSGCFRYTEIANMKKTKSQFEQEVNDFSARGSDFAIFWHDWI